MSWTDDQQRYIWRPFTQEQTAPEPLWAVSGDGIRLTDKDGRSYLDMISSWWVNLHGHAHPKIAEAIAKQAATLEQVIFATCSHEPGVTLARRLAEILPGDLERVFYTDNGSTAVEAALKIALQYRRNRGESQRDRFVALSGGYHGDTVGAMSAGKSSNFFNAWTELLFPVASLPAPTTFMDDSLIEAKESKALAKLDDYLSAHGHQVIAAIVEPLVQGAGGMRMHRPEFLKAWVARLRDAGALIIFDEVMTGFGRTGPLFASERAGVTPDLICLSKGISGGFLPLAATVVTPEIYETFLGDTDALAFLHGHSYTANPIACAAALASLDLTLDPACSARRSAIEAIHLQKMRELGEHTGVEAPRVMGTIAALTLKPKSKGDPNLELKRFFHQDGMLIRPMGDTLYLLPPYVATDEELSLAYDSMRRGLDRVYGE